MSASIYNNAVVALATKHRKETVIAPSFEKDLGMKLVLPDVDTDRLGTFTGEIARTGDALQTAIDKAKLAMKKTGMPYGLASEGSFGPHQLSPLWPAI